MHKAQKVSVSIVIPVYNEAAHLPACLDAIARQTVRPHEVIVVDNNSTDGSAEIASRYSFVKVIHAKRQGVVHARNRGFSAARGDIIGRIDADTIITENWIQTVRDIFSDRQVGAVSGSARYYDMALASLLNRIDLMLRRYFAFVLGDEVALQGANMAIRRSVWSAVRGSLCRKGGMHEDFDLSIHTYQRGYTVRFDESLIVSLACRQTEARFRDFLEYILLSPRTYALHQLSSRVYMYPVIGLLIVFYHPLKMLHRGYDSENDRFSWTQLMQSPGRARVNPATFVD